MNFFCRYIVTPLARFEIHFAVAGFMGTKTLEEAITLARQNEKRVSRVYYIHELVGSAWVLRMHVGPGGFAARYQ